MQLSILSYILLIYFQSSVLFLFMSYYHLLKRLVRKVEIEDGKSKVNSLPPSFADNKTNYSMHFECGRNVVWAASGGAPNPHALNCAGPCWAVLRRAELCQ